MTCPLIEILYSLMGESDADSNPGGHPCKSCQRAPHFESPCLQSETTFACRRLHSP